MSNGGAGDGVAVDRNGVGVVGVVEDRVGGGGAAAGFAAAAPIGTLQVAHVVHPD